MMMMQIGLKQPNGVVGKNINVGLADLDKLGIGWVEAIDTEIQLEQPLIITSVTLKGVNSDSEAPA